VLKVPPPRYKIVERNRRLVTIDNWSGQVVTSGSVAAREAAAVDLEMAPAPPSPWAARTVSNANPDRNPPSSAESPRGSKILALTIGGILFVLFLILSGAWIPFLILVAIPAIRTPVWNALRRGIGRFLEG
jgi:hypothetical protein